MLTETILRELCLDDVDKWLSDVASIYGHVEVSENDIRVRFAWFYNDIVTSPQENEVRQLKQLELGTWPMSSLQEVRHRCAVAMYQLESGLVPTGHDEYDDRHMESKSFVKVIKKTHSGEEKAGLPGSEDIFDWKKEYAVGIQEVDEQHKTLVKLVNSLYDAIINNHEATVLRNILDRLVEYTGVHFLIEESVMRIVDYPGFSIHKKQHEYLLNKVRELQRKLDQENVKITFNLLRFLKSWLTYHIIESDSRYAIYIKQQMGTTQDLSWTKETREIMENKKWWEL